MEKEEYKKVLDKFSSKTYNLRKHMKESEAFKYALNLHSIYEFIYFSYDLTDEEFAKKIKILASEQLKGWK